VGLQQIERLTVEYQTLETEADEDDAEAVERMEAIDQRLAELEASAGETYADAVKAITGAIVTVSQSGGVRIERGCAKPGADTKALRALEGQDKGSGSRGSAYPTPERPKRANGALADRLVLDLSAHRTAAIRASLLHRPDVALVAVTHALLVQTHYGCAVYDRPTTFELSADTLTNHPQRHCQGYPGSKAGQALTSARGRMTLLLPTSSRELWGYLMERSQDQLLELQAYAASNLVNGLVASHNQVNTDRVRAADALASALDLNMADWWEATAESFFGRVSKPTILAVVAEVSTAQAADNIAGLKKAELAAEAEKRVAGKGWLPSLLRSDMAAPAPVWTPAPTPQVDAADLASDADDDGFEGGEDEDCSLAAE
jgi:ParB family chromosome partitioning protein